MQRQGLVESITLWLLFSAPNLWALHNIKTALEPLVTQLCTNEKFHSSVQRPAKLDPFPPRTELCPSWGVYQHWKIVDYRLEWEKERQSGKVSGKKKKDGERISLFFSSSSSSLLPVFRILVWSKVFAQVLMGWDDLEILVTEDCWMSGGLCLLSRDSV